MELEVLKKDKNHAEFVLKGERHTFPNLLNDRLLQDSSVIFSSYILAHPLDKDAKFIVKTKGKTAKQALTAALSKVEKDVADFDKAVKKAFK